MPFLKDTSGRPVDLAAAHHMVVRSADLLGGTPVIRGTRIPVHDVAASVAAGHSIERILEAYPRLDREKVRLAVIYALSNPARSQPRGPATLPEGSVIITERRVRRSRDEAPDRETPPPTD